MTVASIPFDRIASRYDATRGGEARGQHTAAAFAPWLPPGPVVEIGVGTGVVAAALAAQGRSVVGLDLALPMLAEAMARLPGCLAQGDLLAPPFRPGSAAAVIAVHVLHVAGDQARAVQAAASLLRPGGRFVVSGVDGNRVSADDVGEIDRTLADRLRPWAVPVSEEVIGFASSAGLHLVHDGHMPRRSFEHSPAEAAAHLESRAWSWCWDLPDDLWAAEVEPTIARLRGLPDPQRPRPAWIEWRYLVLER